MPTVKHKWLLKLRLELTAPDHLVTTIEIILGYRTHADLTINLALAKRLIKSNNLEPITLEPGRLIFVEGINASTGEIIKQINR